MEYFGDSYDIVKQSLLRWLRSFGEWAVYPMFTEDVSDQDKEAFGEFLVGKIISKEKLTTYSNREEYFIIAANCKYNLFLDPDIGVKYNNKSPNMPAYIMFNELVNMVKKRPNLLTLVFDQSLARGKEREQLQRKLDSLLADGIYGVAYVSHACFMLISCNKKLIETATKLLLKKSLLPVNRFILKICRLTTG
jgi:hypothetical protein